MTINKLTALERGNPSNSNGADVAESVNDLIDAEASNQLTTADLISSTAIFTADTNITTKGFTTSGDGGSGSWVQNGVTGQTVSQSPAQLGSALLNDGNGNQWVYVPLSGTAKLEVEVLALGAKFDNVTDDILPLQAASNAVADVALKPLGGGVVRLPKGIARTSKKLEVDSDVALIGAGKTQTYIKPLNTAVFAINEAVVQSTDFETVQGTNLWDYYSPYPNGLTMGVTIRDLTIDGNRANVANAGGLNIYGGKWDFQNIGVINCDSHCIWTEAGIPVSSTSGDDLEDYLNMHESYGSNIYICNSNKHGWFYRGPNDTSIGDVQIKTCNWGGFFQESTGNNSVGNLEIGSLHAYSCNCAHDADGAMITLASANVQFLYVDASLKNGLITTTSAVVIDFILVLGNNQQNNGNFWGVKLNVATQVGMIRNSEKVRTSGTDGGLLQVNSASCVIDQIRTAQSGGTTISQKGIEVNAQCSISRIVVENYNSVGSKGVDVFTDRAVLGITAKACETALKYQVAGRNNITLNALDCTTDIEFTVPLADSDTLLLTTNKEVLTEQIVGKSTSKSRNFKMVDASFTSTYQPNMKAGSYFKVNALTGDIDFLTPNDLIKGDVMTIQLQQDGTGGRAVTFSSDYKHNYVDTGNTAFKRHTITFVHDGVFFIQQGAPSGWF